MDISSLFPNSDNLYKYLFTGGLVMVIFGIVYSFEQRQKLLLDINVFNKQTCLLKEEISQVKAEVAEITTSIREQNSVLSDTSVNEAVKKNIRKERYKNISTLKEKNNELKIKSILLDHDGEKIIISSRLHTEIRLYSISLIILGGFSIGYGLYKWKKFTETADEKNDVELQILRKSLKED